MHSVYILGLPLLYCKNKTNKNPLTEFVISENRSAINNDVPSTFPLCFALPVLAAQSGEPDYTCPSGT